MVVSMTVVFLRILGFIRAESDMQSSLRSLRSSNGKSSSVLSARRGKYRNFLEAMMAAEWSMRR